MKKSTTKRRTMWTDQTFFLKSGAAVTIRLVTFGFEIDYRGDTWERDTRTEALGMVKEFQRIEDCKGIPHREQEGRRNI